MPQRRGVFGSDSGQMGLQQRKMHLETPLRGQKVSAPPRARTPSYNDGDLTQETLDPQLYALISLLNQQRM